MHSLPQPKQPLLFATTLAFLLVLSIELLTNRLDLEQFQWPEVYRKMALQPFWQNPNLEAPYAYRWGTTELVRLLMKGGLSVDAAFLWIARTGAFLQLLVGFLFSRLFTKRLSLNLLAMVFLAFSFIQLKFLLFDPYRPDHLAYPLVAVAAYATLRHQLWLLIVATVIGLQFREFLAVPATVAFLLFVWNWWRNGKPYTLLRPLALGMALLLAVLLPRLLLPVAESDQYIDPLNRSDTLYHFYYFLINWIRNLNYLLVTLSYLLPSLVLLVLRPRLWQVLRSIPIDMQLFIGLYTLLVLVLSYIGGNDILRFVSYLFIPQIALLILVMDQQPLKAPELLYMLIAVFIFNRIPFAIPQDSLETYLSFYSFFPDRLNLATGLRTLEMGGWLAGAFLLRKALHHFAPTQK